MSCKKQGSKVQLNSLESVVQLVERCIHIAKVTGPSPVGFTRLSPYYPNKTKAP